MRSSDLAALKDSVGLISRAALLEAGVPVGTIATWLNRRLLVEVTPRIYRRANDPLTFEMMCAAATSWAGEGAALSHHTAAALHELNFFVREPPIHVSCSYKLVQPASEFALVLHDRRKLDVDHDLTRRGGLSVTGLDRTLLDLASSLSAFSLDRVLDEVLRQRKTTGEKLKAIHARVERRGNASAKTYGNVLHLRRNTLVRLDSKLEQKFLDLFVGQGLPPPEPQVWITKWDARYRTDFAYRQYNLAIEIDSFKWHKDLGPWTEDVTKSNDLVAFGWSVLRFTEEDLVRPGYVGLMIKEALVARGW